MNIRPDAWAFLVAEAGLFANAVIYSRLDVTLWVPAAWLAGMGVAWWAYRRALG